MPPVSEKFNETWEQAMSEENGEAVRRLYTLLTRGDDRLLDLLAPDFVAEARVANVWTFRDGKPVELKYFGEDRAAALEAAGLGD